MRRLLALLSIASLLTGCAKKEACSEADRKASVLDLAQSYYLYQDLLPSPTPSLADFTTADQLLEALTAGARAQGLERDGWTSLESAAAYDQYFRQGQSVGYGFSLVLLGSRPSQRLVVRQVFAGSAADRAGFVRGDEILAVGPDEASLSDVADADGVAAMASPGGVAGVARTFGVLPRGGAGPVLRTMVSAGYDVDPVPSYRVFDGGVGYVQLRTFIAPAEPALRAAFAAFRAAGVRDVIVDLRYNGGGAVSTAMVLADLLSADLAGRPMFTMHYNAKHSDRDQQYAFAADPAGGTFRRVAFLVTGASASASELVPNALDAYRDQTTIAYAGARTYGKPVGQIVFSLEDCDAVLFLISFKLENAAGDAGYFDGLPDANSHAPLCGAEDDLGHEQGDPAEAMTGAAKYFVEHGACPAQAALRALGAPVPVDYLVGAEATPAARDMPGTF